MTTTTHHISRRNRLSDGGIAHRTANLNMNAIAERFVGSIKRECLSKLILLGLDQLRRAVHEFVEHYNAERPHQGIGNRVLKPGAAELPTGSGTTVVDERLGGLQRSYRRVA